MNMRSSRGYSVMEMLVVVAIIGILSLVTIPSFINFQRRNQVRSALRSFTADLRGFRQHAITKNAYVRVQFRSEREYEVFQSRDFGQTWRPLNLGSPVNDAGGTERDRGRNVRTLPETLRFSANTYNDSDSPVDQMPDVDFHPDGTAGDYNGGAVTAGKITLRTDWADILNQVVVDMSTTGQIKTTESKT
jgi:prepilin-type N-terminal cleavage/methylation domain-containing protein